MSQRWLAWFKDVETRGHLALYGHPREPQGGGVLTDKNGTVSDGPYAETKDIVIGFSVIEARMLTNRFRQGAHVDVQRHQLDRWRRGRLAVEVAACPIVNR